MKEEALKLADQLENDAKFGECDWTNPRVSADMIRRLVEELDKQELFNKENPVKEVFNNEPVAWMDKETGQVSRVACYSTPLYTTPQIKEVFNSEPVAWMTENGTIFDELPPISGGLMPLYTTPQTIQSEPVAWIYERPNGSAKLVWVREPHDKSIIKEIPLYTAPQTNQGEPVAWTNQMCLDMVKEDGESNMWWMPDLAEDIPLYTTPQTKPLSDEEITFLWHKSMGLAISDDNLKNNISHASIFARAIEAKVRGEE